MSAGTAPDKCGDKWDEEGKGTRDQRSIGGMVEKISGNVGGRRRRERKTVVGWGGETSGTADGSVKVDGVCVGV